MKRRAIGLFNTVQRHGALLAVSALLLLEGCGRARAEQSAAPAPPPARVQVVRLSREATRMHEDVVGTVRARLRATLEAKASGRVVRFPVYLGETVQRGQLLAQLDAGDLEARHQRTRAVMLQAQADLKRTRFLLERQAVAAQAFERAQMQFNVARAADDEVRTMLSYAVVRAPFTGVVSRKLADRGDLASPGRPLLELEDPRQLRLEVAVPEAMVGFVHVGNRLEVRLASPEQNLEAVVAEIAPAADPQSRTFLAKLDLPSREGVRLGQFGRAYLPTQSQRLLRVPLSAVVSRGQLELVFVVENGRARLRLVRTGKRFADGIEIVAGLEPGETVVCSDPAGLVDGQRVEVRG